MNHRGLQGREHLKDDAALDGADKPMLGGSMYGLANPSFVEHDVPSSLRADLQEASAQTERQAAILIPVRHELETGPVGLKTIYKRCRHANALAPRKGGS